MASDSRSVGESRPYANFVATARKATSSLHGQAAPPDGFAELFRLMANSSPPPAPRTSNDSQQRSDTKGDRRDAPTEGASSRSAAEDEAKRTERASAERSPSEASPDAALLQAMQEQPPESVEEISVPVAAETGPLATAENADAPVVKPEVAAAGQQRSTKSAETPQSEAIPASEMPEVETPAETQVVGEATEATAVGSTGAPRAVQTVATSEENGRTPHGPPVAALQAEGEANEAATEPAVTAETKANTPATEKLAESKTAARELAASTAPQTVMPADSRSAEVQETLPKQEVGIEQSMPEDAGKPIFSSSEGSEGDSRRRHQPFDPQSLSMTVDANRMTVEPTLAERLAAQSEKLAAGPGFDASSAQAAAGELQGTTDAQQTPTATQTPVVAAAAAAGRAGSEATSPGANASKAAPQIGAITGETQTRSTAQQGKAEADSGPGIADRIRLIQRVANAFQRLGIDGGQVRIRLHPAELGGVRLELEMQGKRLNARVLTETEAARGVLREHLGDLRQRLVEQGVQVERIDVELETDAQGHQDSAGQEGQAERFGQSQRQPRRFTAARGEAAVGEVATHPTSRSQPRERSLAEAASRPGVDLVF